MDLTMRQIFRFPKNLRLAFCAAAAAGILAGPAAAQSDPAELRALVDKLSRVERDLRDLQREVYAGERPGGGEFGGQAAPVDSGMSVRVLELERELRLLTGRVEELQYELRRALDRLEQFTDDAEYRLQALESGRAGGPTVAGGFGDGRTAAQDRGFAAEDAFGRRGFGEGAFGQGADRGADRGGDQGGDAVAPFGAERRVGDNPQTDRFGARDDEGFGRPGAEPSVGEAFGSAGAGAGASPLQGPLSGASSMSLSLPGEPDALFDEGYNLLLRGDYADAEIRFSAFVEAFPDHERAPEAQHRLGETQFVQGAFGDAATSFLASVQNYPRSERAPESLLRLGMSLYELGEAAEACRTYNSLEQRYPNASQTVRQRLNVERRRAGCE